MSSRVPIGRVVAVAGLCGLALAACGRRGPLEAPPDVAARTALGPAVEGQSNAPSRTQVQDGATSAEEVVPSPVPSPRTGGRKRGYVVPQDPFVLDPLL